MEFKDGDKVKVRDAVSVDVLIYDMFRIIKEDDCGTYLNTALELMNDTLTVMVNEYDEDEDNGVVCVLESRGLRFYISAELLELVEENDVKDGSITVADYFEEILTRIEAIESRVVAIEYRLDSLK